MNKKLIALAIATAVSAPAMAATSNVDVYGLMSVGVDSVNNNNAAAGDSSKRVGRVSDYASRIGFKGTEDVGNGLSAIWQIESQVSVDGGSATNTNGSGNLGGATTAFGGQTLRNTFVGLKSKEMGTALIGKYDTPYKSSTLRLDPFGDTLADYNNIVGAANNGGNAGGYFDLRPANTAVYMTPNFSGFNAAASYVFGAESATTGSSTGNLYSLAAMYDAGPLYLTAAYEKQNFGSPTSGSLAGTVANTTQKAWKLGAAYNIMDFTLAALYEKTDDNRGTTGANLYGHRTWFLSGKYQMGAVALKASYANAGSDEQTIAGVKGSDGAKSYTLGADYAFSKRTTMYALYTRISNDSNATYNFYYSPAVGVGGGDRVDGFSLGVKHSF